MGRIRRYWGREIAENLCLGSGCRGKGFFAKVSGRLKGKGNSIVIIEHNLDVIKTADWIVDLGPEGGDGGGRIIASGSPEQVAKIKGSYTGKYLKVIL